MENAHLNVTTTGNIEQESPQWMTKHSMFYGTITGTNKAGAYIRLNVGNRQKEDYAIPQAFAFCCGNVGDKVLVSVRRYDEKHRTILVNIDSFVYYNQVDLYPEPDFAA